MQRNEPAHEPVAGPCPPWPAAFRALLQCPRVLLLQGPMGGFFGALARLLISRGCAVTKVHFNGGDELFFRPRRCALRFNGRAEDLEPWLARLIAEREIGAVVMFGQFRAAHVVARRVARAAGAQVFVFEEGYLRPDYVTIERRGVNALSRQPRQADFYRRSAAPEPAPPQPTGQAFWRLALLATAYAVATQLLRPLYWRQQYHRSLSLWGEPWRWARGAWRKFRDAGPGRRLAGRLTGEALSGRWFLLPLQVHNDSQVVEQPHFCTMERTIEHVVASFAAHADADAHLVVKHHPMDRAYRDYAALLNELARGHGLTGRLHYVHDLHLPTVLRHARGVVTLNSTVGLQALHHGTPVKTMADSVYQIPGLVYEGSLEAFWADPGEVDRALVRRFRSHLIAATQLNASFYARRPALEGAARTSAAVAAAADGAETFETADEAGVAEGVLSFAASPRPRPGHAPVTTEALAAAFRTEPGVAAAPAAEQHDRIAAFSAQAEAATS